MSTATKYTDETAEGDTATSESLDEYWLLDESFDNMVDIINENFILEVKASLELRG